MFYRLVNGIREREQSCLSVPVHHIAPQQPENSADRDRQQAKPKTLPQQHGWQMIDSAQCRRGSEVSTDVSTDEWSISGFDDNTSYRVTGPWKEDRGQDIIEEDQIFDMEL
jgi:hypothetical protein